jgi:hypothetical protein
MTNNRKAFKTYANGFIAIALLMVTACEASPVSPMTAPDLQTPSPVARDTAIPTMVEPTPALSATETPTSIPSSPTPIPPSIDDLRPQYTITATLDFAWRILTVEQELVLPNPSKDTLQELSLVVQTNWRPGSFNLTRLTAADGTPIWSYTLEGIHLKVLLPRPLPPGETLQLYLTYEINIPPIVTSEDFGPNPFGYTSRQVNLTDWYPFVPPYVEGEGWLVHNPWYYGEHLVYPAADFEITLAVTNAPASTVVAASARDTGENGLHHYQLEAARTFVFSISPEYRISQAQVGATTVLGYAFPYDIVPGEAAFKATVQAMELYNQLFGPYPYETMTLIEADFNHGMEYSGLYFLSNAFYGTYDGTPSSYLVVIAAHETAHQWWFGLVGNDQALEPWLDEALCTYSEKLFLENLHPGSLNWWQYARVDYYAPSGWVDSTLYNTPGYRPYRDAVYLNGALFLDELRSRVGDEAFFAFLKDYLQQYSHRIATSADFFTTLRDHSDADWSDLLTRYFQYP